MLSARGLPLAALLLFLLGAAVTYTLGFAPAGERLGTLVIDMELKQRSTVEIFWNDFSAETPLQVTHPGGGRGTVQLALPRTRIYRLRIEPTRDAMVKVAIHRIAIRLPNRADREIPLAEVLSWSFVNTTKPLLTDGVLSFQTTTNDPYFYGPIDLVKVSWHDRVFNAIHNYLRSNDFIVHVILFGALATFGLAVSLTQSLAVATTIPLFLAVLYYGPGLLIRLLGPDHPDVSQAVGHEAIFGLSVNPERWITVALAVAAIVLGVAYGRLKTKRNGAGQPLVASSPPWRRPPVAREFVVAGLVAIILSGLLLPDLRLVANGDLHGMFNSQWDSDNLVTWAGFVAEGKRPYLDFWYPYSGMWTFDLPLPWGPLFRLLHLVVLFTTLAVAIWRLLEGGVTWLATIVCIVALSESGIIQAFDRYLISVAIVVTYVAEHRDEPFWRSGRLWFWTSCVTALWIEPAQLIYAAPGVCIAMISDELEHRTVSFRDVLLRAARDFLVPAGSLLGLFAILAVNGEFPGFAETNFENLLGSIYGLVPTSLGDEVTQIYSARFIGAFAPFVLLLSGATLVGSLQDVKDRKLALAVISTAAVGIMTLQKHLIREIDGQLLAPSIVSALLLLCLLSRQSPSRLAGVVILGVLTVGAGLNPALASFFRATIDVPRTIASDAELPTRQPLMLTDANRAAFSRPRFAQFVDELAIIDRLHAYNKRSIFVLGDVPILYLFTAGPIPFHINDYDASPLRAQENLRVWLERTKPDAVIFNSSYLFFDDFSVAVRDPIILSSIVANYVPSERMGRYSLLFPRAGDQSIPLDKWRDLLGADINYGFMLSDIQRTPAPHCTPNLSYNCLKYLIVTFDTDGAGPFKLTVEVGHWSFSISFMRVSGQRSYLVPIDRIWFWVAGEAKGFAPHVRTKDMGVHVSEMTAEARKGRDLY